MYSQSNLSSRPVCSATSSMCLISILNLCVLKECQEGQTIDEGVSISICPEKASVVQQEFVTMT